ncbi:MAG: potassium channel family protein [Patescibacteria group bacterium]
MNIRSWVLLTSFAGLLLLGTLTYHALEDWSWVQSFYFSVVTLTTVGYGDLAPTTDGSRLFTSVYILFGVAIAISFLGVVANKYVSHTGRRRKK